MFRLLRKGGFRFFSSVPRQERFGPVSPSASSRATRTWRDEPVPTSSLPSSVVPSGLPALRPGHLLPSPTLQHTTLPNGLHVSSQETYGQVATLALFIEAGSMYEGADEIGACHFFETTAYKATMGLSAAELLAFTQREGLTTSAVFNREVLVFKVEALRGSVDNAMRVIAEAALRPEFSDTVLEEGASSSHTAGARCEMNFTLCLPLCPPAPSDSPYDNVISADRGRSAADDSRK